MNISDYVVARFPRGGWAIRNRRTGAWLQQYVLHPYPGVPPYLDWVRFKTRKEAEVFYADELPLLCREEGE